MFVESEFICIQLMWLHRSRVLLFFFVIDV